MKNIIAGTVLAALAVTVGASPAEAGSARPHQPCAYEDDSWCVWDARHMGMENGGNSYWTGHRGRVHVISHRYAHRLLEG